MKSMRGPLVSVLLALLANGASPHGAAPQQPSPAEVDAVFAEYDESGSVGCALGVARNGKFLYKQGYGYASLDWDIPISATTVFYVGSVSKQFTAASIALLAAEGQVSLDADIRTYLPEMPRRDPAVTVRQVVHHISGIPDMYSVMRKHGVSTRDQFSRDEALALLASLGRDVAGIAAVMTIPRRTAFVVDFHGQAGIGFLLPRMAARRAGRPVLARLKAAEPDVAVGEGVAELH